MSQHFPWELAQKRSLPLDIKISMTKMRIQQWYLFHGGDVYVSFSGGKDSTVLLHIARQLYPDIPTVYCDTGLEYPELREFVKTIDNVTWLKPEMNFRKVIENYGYPVVSKETSQKIYEVRHTHSEKLRNIRLYGEGHSSSKIAERWKFLIDAPFEVSHKRCEVMKKRPFRKYEKTTGFHPIVATMAEESELRKQSWLKYGCNAFGMKRPMSRPMSFWTECDVLEYLLTYDVPYASVYGEIVEDEKNGLKTTGCQRTGCMFCMYGCHMEPSPNKFQRMAQTHPTIYHYCMKPWNEGGLGLADVLNFIGIEH